MLDKEFSAILPQRCGFYEWWQENGLGGWNCGIVEIVQDVYHVGGWVQDDSNGEIRLRPRYGDIPLLQGLPVVYWRKTNPPEISLTFVE